jgi:hypothetical protein
MTEKQHLQAEAAYENAHLVAQDLVGRIRELLEDLPAPSDEHPIRWTQVEELVYANARLAEVAKFLERA